MTEQKRVSFNISHSLYKDLAIIPYGIRSAIIRSLLKCVVNKVRSKGSAVYGLILDDSFDIVYKETGDD